MPRGNFIHNPTFCEIIFVVYKCRDVALPRLYKNIFLTF
jgi:hypothetical protein